MNTSSLSCPLSRQVLNKGLQNQEAIRACNLDGVITVSKLYYNCTKVEKEIKAARIKQGMVVEEVAVDMRGGNMMIAVAASPITDEDDATTAAQKPAASGDPPATEEEEGEEKTGPDAEHKTPIAPYPLLPLTSSSVCTKETPIIKRRRQ